MEEIITPSQVAAVLLVNVKTVYRLAKKGAIPDNKIGRCWRFIKKDVLDLVSNGQRKRSRRYHGHKNHNPSDRKHGDIAATPQKSTSIRRWNCV